MFGIGMPEMILILAIALIVIGPKKLPDLARSLGRAMREFRKATNEFKESIQLDQELSDVKRSFTKLDDHTRTTAEPAGDETKPSVENSQEKSPEQSEAPPGSDNLSELKQAFDKWNTDSAPSEPTAPVKDAEHPPTDDPKPKDPKGSGGDAA